MASRGGCTDCPRTTARRPDREQRSPGASGGQLHLRSLSTGRPRRRSPAGLRTQSRRPVPGGARCHAPLHVRFPEPDPTRLRDGTPTASSLAFSADGKLLGIAYTSAPARLYPVPDLTLIGELGANQGPSLAAAMDPQNRYLAISSGKNIQLYQLPSGNLVPVCFMDIAASSPSSSGTQYIVGGVVYTVGCGVPTPAGVACSCDCVPGDCPCVTIRGAPAYRIPVAVAFPTLAARAFRTPVVPAFPTPAAAASATSAVPATPTTVAGASAIPGSAATAMPAAAATAMSVVPAMGMSAAGVWTISGRPTESDTAPASRPPR